jgi:hypothetical protein
MPVNTTDLENVIRSALPVAHLEIEDQSNGCGENYAIILVSEVRYLQIVILEAVIIFCLFGYLQTFEGKSTLVRHRLSECGEGISGRKKGIFADCACFAFSQRIVEE